MAGKAVLFENREYIVLERNRRRFRLQTFFDFFLLVRLSNSCKNSCHDEKDKERELNFASHSSSSLKPDMHLYESLIVLDARLFNIDAVLRAYFHKTVGKEFQSDCKTIRLSYKCISGFNEELL